MIKDFEYYLNKGVVKKHIKDIERAKNLIKTAKERLKTASSISIPGFQIEFIYEAIIEYIEAIMSLEGYKSYSHEADIAYLKNLKVPEEIIRQIDKLRRMRHKSKYYGGDFKKEDVEFALNVANKIIKLLDPLIKNKMTQ